MIVMKKRIHIAGTDNDTAMVNLKPDIFMTKIRFLESNCICHRDGGVYVIETQRGTRWGVVRLYSKIRHTDGTCRGEYLEAHDLNKPGDREIFRFMEECCR